ncbi:MAG: sialidase family protein [Opitutaceae bacterium]
MISSRTLHRLRSLFGGLLLFAFSVLSASAQPAGPEFFSIYDDPKEDGVMGYHLPQILCTRQGTLLALVEARYRWGDGVKADVVLRRSTDRGATWSKSQFVARGKGDENHVLPVLVQDKVSGRIFFFCPLRDEGAHDLTTQNFYRTSDDDGVTWSDPVDITSLLVAAEARLKEDLQAGRAPAAFAGDTTELFGRKLFFFGPGRPIQLSATHPVAPHRLVVPLFLMKDRVSQPRAKRAYGNGALVSDDGGRTWRVGGFVPLGEFGSSEVSVVELDDGRLLLNARGAPPESKGFSVAGRTLSYSSDGGTTWTRPVLDTSGIPQYPETHSGLLRVPLGDMKDPRRSALLFSFPAGLPEPGKPVRVTARSEGTVMLSLDDHRSWVARKVVRPGTFGYSNMDRLPDNTLVMIFTDANLKQVWLARFTLDWLSDGKVRSVASE